MTIHRRFGAGLLGGRGKTSFENMQPHDVAHRVMKHERQKIKVHDTMKPLCEVVKKSRQVAMLRDRFRHFEQGFELTPRVFERRCSCRFGRGYSGIRHRNQNSTRLARRSTNALWRG